MQLCTREIKMVIQKNLVLRSFSQGQHKTALMNPIWDLSSRRFS